MRENLQGVCQDADLRFVVEAFAVFIEVAVLRRPKVGMSAFSRFGKDATSLVREHFRSMN